MAEKRNSEPEPASGQDQPERPASLPRAGSDAGRAERLAAALRANLARRKAQARDRAAGKGD